MVIWEQFQKVSFQMKLGGNRASKDLALSLGKGGKNTTMDDKTKAAAEVAKAQGIGLGIMSCSDKEGTIDLAEILLSRDITEISLSETGMRQLANFMIEKGFDGSVEQFVLAFSGYREELFSTSEAFNERQQIVLDQYLLESISILTSGLKDGTRCGAGTIRDAAMIGALISDSHRGAVNHLLRLCGKTIDPVTVDQYCEQHHHGFNPGQCFADNVRDRLIEGLFTKLGFWRIWCLVRRFFIGKNPDEAEAEMEREKELAVIHAILRELQQYPVDLKEKAAREDELIARLNEIDPDCSVPMT